MILKAFCLLDAKTGFYNVPWFQSHVGQAFRTVVDLASDPSTLVGRHPADFILCEIGTFDDQVGALTPIMPVNLGSAASFLEANRMSQNASRNDGGNQ